MDALMENWWVVILFVIVVIVGADQFINGR